MNKPTYRDLLHILQNMNPDNLDDNIAIYDEELDEVIPADYTFFSEPDGVTGDVLDEGHFVIAINQLKD